MVEPYSVTTLGMPGFANKPRAVAVVAGDIAQLVNVAALASADGRRPRRIEFV